MENTLKTANFVYIFHQESISGALDPQDINSSMAHLESLVFPASNPQDSFASERSGAHITSMQSIRDQESPSSAVRFLNPQDCRSRRQSSRIPDRSSARNGTGCESNERFPNQNPIDLRNESSFFHWRAWWSSSSWLLQIYVVEHAIAIKEKRAVGARKKLGFGGTWSILEQVGGRGRYVVEGACVARPFQLPKKFMYTHSGFPKLPTT